MDISLPLVFATVREKPTSCKVQSTRDYESPSIQALQRRRIVYNQSLLKLRAQLDVCSAELRCDLHVASECPYMENGFGTLAMFSHIETACFTSILGFV